MSQLIIKEFNGKQIRVREDGYFSATDMCQAVGKQIGHWRENKATFEYLLVLEQSIGIPTDQLIEINESHGSNNQRGTWVHRRVAIRLAQWCSANFAVQVDSWIEELFMTGTVSIKEQPKQTIEPEKVNAEVVTAYTQAIYNLQDNGDVRLAALLKTKFGNVLQADLDYQALPSIEERVEGAVECAIRLGFVVPKNYESSLGKHVKKHCGHLIKGQNQRFSYTSNQSISAFMYPYANAEFETSVRNYCVDKAFKNRNLILGEVDVEI